MKHNSLAMDLSGPLLHHAETQPLVAGSEWLGLDNWKTLFRATYPEPIRELQIATGYKLDSLTSQPDPDFMRVCLTTASQRVLDALAEKRLVEEDPDEFLWLVGRKLDFRVTPAAVAALAEIVENEKNGLCKFLDVSPELKRLRQMGLKLALVSNAWPFPMPQIFNEEDGGISLDDFDQLVLSYEVGYAKPTPEFYQEMRRRCGSDACMMVGDNPELDVRAPMAIGMRAVHLDRYGDCKDRVPGVPVIRKLKQLYVASDATA
ncbi:MAG: HAD family hydrolase [Cyanobacteria bacterium]|nr:HAD family hydrolase [Cyanobacteriota bacterium]